MSKLDRIAIENLKIINRLCDNDECQILIDGNKLTESCDDNYEGMFDLKSFEYPIYFTYYQLLNSIRYSNLYKIEGYKTRYLIWLMDNGIDKILSILDKTKDDPHNQIIYDLIDDIDDKYIILKERDTTCSFWKICETFNDYLDTVTETLKECNRYLYFSDGIIMTDEEVEEVEEDSIECDDSDTGVDSDPEPESGSESRPGIGSDCGVEAWLKGSRNMGDINTDTEESNPNFIYEGTSDKKSK